MFFLYFFRYFLRFYDTLLLPSFFCFLVLFFFDAVDSGPRRDRHTLSF